MTKKTTRWLEATTTRREKVQQAIDDHHVRLFYYLKGLTKNHHDAENIIQELWVYALFKFREDKIQCFKGLRWKARLLFLDHLRKVRRRAEMPYETDEEGEDETHKISKKGYLGTDEDDSRDQKRFWAKFPKLTLTVQQKEAMWLIAYHKCTYRQVAEVLKVSPSTIGDWVGLARKRIAAVLNEKQGGSA